MMPFLNFSRKQKYILLLILVCVSISVMFYGEISINIFNPNKQFENSFTEPETLFISKHILEASKSSDIVVFLWDPQSQHDDWTGILKSKHLVTKQQIKEYHSQKKIQEQQSDNNNNPTPLAPLTSHQKHNEELYSEQNQCSVSCRFTNIQEELVESHLILFDPIYLHKDNWKRSPLKLPEKHVHQKFATMHYVSKSQYSILGNQLYNNLMDLNLNYINSNYDLDITLACPPNTSFTIKDTENLLLKKHQDFESRRNSAIFISSNCNDGLSLSRTNLVKILSKIIKVESLGKCLNSGEENKIKGKEELLNIDSRIEYNMNIYKEAKFVICFENENSTNYVTEKVYTALYAGAIPIWMGAKNIDQWVPTGSIINANDFKNIVEIGEHIESIIKGNIDYKRYFKWKESKKLEDKVIDKLERCINSVTSKCKLCETISKSLSLEDKKYRTVKALPSNGDSYHSHYTPLYLEMKGVGDHIVVEESEACKGCFNFDNHFTLMAWVKPNSFNDQRIIDKNQAGTINGYNFDIQKTSDPNRGVARLCAGSNCFESFKTLPNDLWTHVAVVFSCNNLDVQKNRVTFYINGVKNSESENFNPTKINSYPLLIGKSSSTSPSLSSYHGKIDNIMIFNSSLTQIQIQNLLWNKPDNDQYELSNNLLLHYDFDNNPNQKHDSKSNNRNLVRDKSIYKNDGHLSKGPKDDYPEKVISISKEFSFNNKL